MKTTHLLMNLLVMVSKQIQVKAPIIQLPNQSKTLTLALIKMMVKLIVTGVKMKTKNVLSNSKSQVLRLKKWLSVCSITIPTAS
jgi:hypothetical protein